MKQFPLQTLSSEPHGDVELSGRIPPSRKGSEAQPNVILTDFTVFHESPSMNLEAPNNPDQYQTGFAEGLAHAEGVHEAAVKAMENSLAQMKSSLIEMRDRLEASHAQVTRSCIKAILPSLAQHSMSAEIADTINNFARSTLPTGIRASCHPDNKIAADFLRNSPSGLSIKVTENPELTPLNVMFEWDGGRTAIDPDSVLEVLNPLLMSPSNSEQVNP